MADISFNDLVQNLSYGALFVALFVWTLRSNDKREQRYLTILDCYGKQLEQIASTLTKILGQIENIEKRNE